MIYKYIHWNKKNLKMEITPVTRAIFTNLYFKITKKIFCMLLTDNNSFKEMFQKH